MAKLVTKFKYLKSSARKSPGGYAKYIATRDGVEKIDDSQKNAPATIAQMQFVQKMLRDFPDCNSIPEYTDLLQKQTRENASEFISRVLEDYSDEVMSTKTYADYIATRPRAERIGSHGLFTDEGVQVQLSKVSQDLNTYEGNIWTVIISLRREDAERLGFDSGERWRQMLRAHTHELSEQFHIPMQDLRWYAAFHNEGHHPHVHLIVYSQDQKEGYLSEQGVENLRSSFAREIFHDDLLSVYKKQTEHRDNLRRNSGAIVQDIVSQINSGVYDNPELERMLIDLAARLSRVKGKKKYGYLKADIKSDVDAIVSVLAADDRIASLYNLWYEQRENVIKTYTDLLPERVPLVDNPEFKSIKNSVIQEALLLSSNTMIDDSFDWAMPDDSIDEDLEFDDESSSGPHTGNQSKMWELYHEAKQFLNQNDDVFDPKKAISLLIDSAHLGCGPAKYLLGKLFLQGKIVSKNVDYALRWLEESISDDNSFAEYLLGKALLSDSDLEKDINRAEVLLRKSFSHGNKYAAYILGKALLDGSIPAADYKEGLSVLSFSADSGYSPAQYLLGKVFLQGNDVSKDIVRAISYLEKAAEQNHCYAAYLAGKAYLTEPEIKDVSKAIHYLETAAELGNEYAEYRLGKLYLYGTETQQDREKAIDYLSSSAAKGNQYAQQLLHSFRNKKRWGAAISTVRLLHHLSRIIQNRLRHSPQNDFEDVDHKLKRKIDEKKQAQGIKQG